MDIKPSKNLAKNNGKEKNINKEEYNFDWYSKDLGAPLVSIAKYGITFSKAAVEKMGNPPAIKLGFDRENKIIGVKLLEEEGKDGFSFAKKEREDYGYVRINNKGFIKVLRAECEEYDFEETTRFVGKMDNEKGLFIIDLKSPAESS